MPVRHRSGGRRCPRPGVRRWARPGRRGGRWCARGRLPAFDTRRRGRRTAGHARRIGTARGRPRKPDARRTSMTNRTRLREPLRPTPPLSGYPKPLPGPAEACRAHSAAPAADGSKPRQQPTQRPPRPRSPPPGHPSPERVRHSPQCSCPLGAGAAFLTVRGSSFFPVGPICMAVSI